MTCFYIIQAIGGGIADVYLYPPGGGCYVVRDVAIADDLENDIRARYTAWLASAERLAPSNGP